MKCIYELSLISTTQQWMVELRKTTREYTYIYVMNCTIISYNEINQKQMEIDNNHKELLKYEIKYKQLYGDNDMLKQLTAVEQCAEIESILRQSLIKIEERKV